MNYILRTFVCLTLVIVLSGCAEMNILEKIGIITTVGYDFDEDDQLSTTMILLQSDPDAPKNSTIVNGKAITSKGSRIKANLKTPKKLASGQLRVALFGEELARNGLKTIIDTLVRDPSISDLTYLAIVQGNAEELLRNDNEQYIDMGRYVYEELDQNIKNELIPSTTLQEVLHDYYSLGVDPIIPTIKLDHPQIMITGMAIMNNDKMVGTISSDKSFYIKLVKQRYETGSLEVIMDSNASEFADDTKELAIVLDTIKTNNNIELKNKDKLEFNMNLKIDARLLEINKNIDLKNPKNIKTLEEDVKKEMKKEILDLIAYCKSKDSDAFGFGEVYRSSIKDSKLTREKWHEIYKDIKVNVNIDFNILRTGVVE
ncbi:spore germination protein [Bacillus pakistanensis]|uniref:Spore germination protein n=1 Tax=Rossellomorea pakistanensis TaxID=992288 RepID=A0ABS2N7P7_9BACI|nr:Ger(x)C family spore germination protein [Bacillus pakistanensis]MBM7583631.1 spore germination protein [Bacillus pakistanensis]